MRRNLLLTFVAFTMNLPVLAYNFSAENDDGTTIYYNIKSSDDNTVEVTYGSSIFNSYSGEVEIPKTVTYGGTTYIVTGIGKQVFYQIYKPF